jgi:hypothetical protein
MRPLVLAALLAGGGAAPSHRSLGDGGWHAAHPGFVSPTTKAPATNAASQRPVFDPAKQLPGCAGVDTLNSNFQHNKFQMVVALKPWRFLATIEMRFKSVSAREAAGLNLAKTAGARVLGWLPAARGRPQSLFFQTTTNAINTGLGGNSFRVEGVGTIDTKAVTFHCEGLGFDCGEGCAKVDCGNGATAAYQARRRRRRRHPRPPPPPPAATLTRRRRLTSRRPRRTTGGQLLWPRLRGPRPRAELEAGHARRAAVARPHDPPRRAARRHRPQDRVARVGLADDLHPR